MSTRTQEIVHAQAAPAFSFRAILAPLAAIVLGTFMAILDTTVGNVALPTLEKVFHTDLHLMQWVITGYILAQAAVIPLAGWLSDRFGAKTIYLTALVLFTLGSALCAVASSDPMLVTFRVLQGLGGGMLQPVGMAFLFRLAPPERRGAVMGAFGIPILLGPALGPVLSGWLVQYAAWPFIFLINVPVGVVAVMLAWRALPFLPAQRAVGALDLPGVVLGPLAFSALSYGVSQSAVAGWSGTSTRLGLGVGIVALALFVLRELLAEQPLLDIRVFRRPAFSLAVLTQWAVVGSLFGTMFLIPLFLQQVRGYGAFDTGIALLPQAIVAALFMPVGGRLYDRFGPRVPVISGLAIATLSLWLEGHVSGSTTTGALLLPFSLWGAGLGLMIMPLNTHVLSTAPRDLVSRVTSLTNALNSVMISLATASIATLMQSHVQAHIAAARAAISSFSHAAIGKAALVAHAQGHPSAFSAPREVLASIHAYTVAAIHDAQAATFDDAFRAAAGIALVGLVLAVTLRRQPVASDAEDAETDEPVLYVA